MDDTQHTTPSKEFTLLMALLMSIVAISIDAFLPALGVVARDLRLSNPNHVQYLISFIFIGMALGQLICGPLSDAWGRKKVLYFGIALYLVGSTLCLLSQSLTMMLLGRFVQGVGVSGPYVCAISVVRDKYSGRAMARIMSFIMMIFILVPAIAPSLGQAILFAASWRAIFMLYLVYSVVIGLWICLRLEETLPPDHRIPMTIVNFAHGVREVCGNVITFSYTLCMGFCFGSFMGYLNASQQIFQDHFQVGKMFTIYFGMLALVFGSASLLNARLVEKWGMQYICRRGFILNAGISVIFLALHLVMPITLPMFLCYAAILFFNFGMVFGNLNALAMEPMGHIAGMASAITGALSSVISLTIGTLIGQMYNGTLIPMASGFLLFSVLSLAIIRFAEARRVVPD